MVVVRDIKANTFTRLGFESKTQALNSYKGIRSLRGESEEDYIKRTWDRVKHVVDKDNANSPKSDSSTTSQYDDLLDKYRELSSIVIQLKNENAILIKAYNNCARRVITSH